MTDGLALTFRIGTYELECEFEVKPSGHHTRAESKVPFQGFMEVLGEISVVTKLSVWLLKCKTKTSISGEYTSPKCSFLLFFLKTEFSGLE